jgi:pimeloyl-ACP methyl ester carboxylesterase
MNNTASINEQLFKLDLGDFQADASLEYPKNSAGPYPTILMFQPVGAYDLDATYSTSLYDISSRNYKVIADQLALHGFAVLRYTKRGYDTSGLNVNPAQDTPIDQQINDAAQVVTQIQSNPLVDPRKLLLLGQDEGTVVAMRLAQAHPEIAGLILIAPITDPQVAWHYQTVDAPLQYAHKILDSNKDGFLNVQEWSSAIPATYLGSLQQQVLVGARLSEAVGSADSSKANIDSELKPFLESLFAKGPQAYGRQQLDLAALFKLGDNTSSLQGFKKPVLLLQGALDQQVPLTQSSDLDAYLAKQGNPNHTLIKYPKLGHSLYKLDRSATDLLGPLDINLAPPNNPVNDMVDWLTKNFSE